MNTEFFDGTFSVKKLPIKFYLQAGLCAALWGSAFPVIKLSYAHLGLETYGEKLLSAGTRFTLAGLVVMLFCRRSVWKSYVDAPKGLLFGVVLGQTFGQYVFFYYGLSVSSGALGVVERIWQHYLGAPRSIDGEICVSIGETMGGPDDLRLGDFHCCLRSGRWEWKRHSWSGLIRPRRAFRRFGRDRDEANRT